MKFVAYKVHGVEGVQYAGPYLDGPPVARECRDIEGYEGVYDVRIVDRIPQMPTGRLKAMGA